MKKKILHLTHTDVFDDNRILKQLQVLFEAGKYDIFSIGVADDEGWSRNRSPVGASVKTIKLYSKSLKWLPKFLRYLLNFIELFIPMFFFGMKRKPVIVHCHDTLVLPIGTLISLLTGATLVYDAHELESDKNGQTKLSSWATLLIEKICWRRIDTLISVSPSILKWYNSKLGFKKSILILNSPAIENASTLESVENERSYFRKLYGIPDTELVFIYLGALVNGRGIELLLKAFSQPGVNSHAVFIGYGALQERILALSKINKNLHLHKPVTHELVVALAKNADIGLCIIENTSLSDYYSLPNKLFEYSFSGLPVLASDFPDISAVVSKFKLGLCTKPDVDAITACIKRMETEPLGQNFCNLNELSWQKQSEILIRCYDEILESKRAIAAKKRN